MYMDKKKDTTKAQEDNVGAFFQTCKVNGCLTVKEFYRMGRKYLTYYQLLRVAYHGNFMGFAVSSTPF